MTVFIKPGMQVTEKMTMRGKGNQQPKLPPTDLHLSFKHVPSEAGSNASKFERKNGNCLMYRHKISLNDALQCCPVKMTTLDGRKLLIAMDQIPSPGSVKVIQGEGMVNIDDQNMGPDAETRGDLYILFDVEFPKRLPTADQRDKLVAALQPAADD